MGTSHSRGTIINTLVSLIVPVVSAGGFGMQCNENAATRYELLVPYPTGFCSTRGICGSACIAVQRGSWGREALLFPLHDVLHGGRNAFVML